jgi:hypothetical protein
MQILNVILGLVLVVLGRPLYWAFVGIAGFFLGVQFAAAYLADQPEWVHFAAAILAGLVGALLAVIAQRVAFAVGGFFAGGYLAGLAVESLAVAGNAQLAVILVGAILGAIIAAVLMDWAIILLSSLMGAGLVASGLELTPVWSAATFVGLTLLGVIIQGSMLTRREEPPRTYAQPTR